MGNEYRRRIANGDEQDAHTRWRYLLCCLQNHPAGLRKTKRATRRRERRELKRETYED